MVPVVLSILVVVLISGAVLWVVAGEVDKPTSEEGRPAEPPPAIAEMAPVAPTPAVIALVPQRRPATSRRRPVTVGVPATIEAPRAAPMVAPSAPTATARLPQAPLPRHRVRSSVLLVLLIAVVGVLLAIVIGALLAALAYALRAAVTS